MRSTPRQGSVIEPGAVRDTRIAHVSPLTTPAALLQRLPLEPEMAELVLNGRDHVEAILDGTDDRLLVVVGPCSVHDPVAALDYARRLRAEAGGHARRRPVHRDARVLREAAHDDRLEGPHQRPAPRRLGRRRRRRGDRARAAARGPAPRPAGRLRVPRPDHPAVHLRHGLVGGDRRAHDREPDPPPARLGPVDAGRLQEPHRRQRAGRRRRRARRRRARTPSPASTTAARRRSCTRPATRTGTSSCAAARASPTTRRPA